MFALIRRCWRSMHKPAARYVLEPVRPRVTPDPEWTAALERRRAAMAYQPETAFHSSTFVRKAQ